jgi:hypothetical protein
VSREGDHMVIFDDKSVKYCLGLHSATTPKAKDEKRFIKKKKTFLQTRNPNKIFYLEFTDIPQAMPMPILPLRLQKKKHVHNPLTWIFRKVDAERPSTL